MEDAILLPDRNGRHPMVEIGGGNRYTGDWCRGSMHGKGEYEFADGRRSGGASRGAGTGEGVHQRSARRADAADAAVGRRAGTRANSATA